MREVQEVGAEVHRRGQPATALEIIAELIKLLPVYGVTDRTDEEAASLFVSYVEALGVLPLEAIREGIIEVNREATFFPRPGEIFKKAEPHAHPLRVAAYRAKRAAEWVERNPPPKTDAERAADRQRAIDEGILDANGKVILNFKPVAPPRPRETQQEAAERLRRIAAGAEEIRTDPLPPPEPEEAI